MNPEAHELSRQVRSAMCSLLQSMACGEPAQSEDVASARENLERLISMAGGEARPVAPMDQVEAFAKFFEGTARSIGMSTEVTKAVPQIARAWARGGVR
jgi:hypothetical protein